MPEKGQEHGGSDNSHFYSNDPYEVLGVPPGSSFDQVKSAWKKIV